MACTNPGLPVILGTTRGVDVEVLGLASKARGIRTVLRGGSALLLGGLLVSSCAAPQYRYIADSGDKTYFKVPYDWKQAAPADVCALLREQLSTILTQFSVAPVPANSKICPWWAAVYEANGKPAVAHYYAGGLTEPYAFAEVLPFEGVTATARPPTGVTVSDQLLDNWVLPYDKTAYGNGAKFKGLLQRPMSVGGGFHGVREIFNIAIPGVGNSTYDIVTLTDPGEQLLYVLAVHCSATCYDRDRTAIEAVMSSFTIRSH